MHAAPCSQGDAVDLSGAVQSIDSMLQAAGQAVQPTLQAVERAAAPAQATAKLEALDATKRFVRDIGVDSNLPNSATPASEEGAARARLLAFCLIIVAGWPPLCRLQPIHSIAGARAIEVLPNSQAWLDAKKAESDGM